MTNFVLGLLVVQVLGGLYQLSFLLGVGSNYRNARASRLPDPLVFGHALLGLVALALWLTWRSTGEEPFVWATFGSLLLSVGGGLVMFARTAAGRATEPVATAGARDVRVAEKRIPKAALSVHGLAAATLVVCVLLVGLGT
jgi:hypothetical protein